MNIQTSHLLEITTNNYEGERVGKIFRRSILKKYFENTILFCILNTFWKVFYFVIFKILSKSILFGIFKILSKSILHNSAYGTIYKSLPFQTVIHVYFGFPWKSGPYVIIWTKQMHVIKWTVKIWSNPFISFICFQHMGTLHQWL